MINKIVLTAAILFVVSISFGQEKPKEIQMKGVTGTAVGSEEETPKQILERALNNAKLEALRRAGIEENISSYSDFFKAETNNNYEEVFTSNVFSDIRGSVVNDKIIDKKQESTPEGGIRYTITIDCTVLKYDQQRDLTFDVKVGDIEKYFKDGTGFAIKVTPYKNCHMRAFVLSHKSESNLIYPGIDRKSLELIAGQSYVFPPQDESKSYDLYTDLQEEVFQLVLVFLKSDIPYIDTKSPKQEKDAQGNILLPTVDYKKVSDWIFSLPPDQRIVKQYSFTVVK